jgi:hypothetical protein
MQLLAAWLASFLVSASPSFLARCFLQSTAKIVKLRNAPRDFAAESYFL